MKGAGGGRLTTLVIVGVQRLMLHDPVPFNRAKRRSGQFQPLARGPHSIAARRALAFQHPGFLLLGRGRLPPVSRWAWGREPAASRIGPMAASKASPGVVARTEIGR